MTLQWYLDTLNQIEEVNKVIKGICECGLPWPLFVKSLYEDLKVLCLTKIKYYDKPNTDQFCRLMDFEKVVKTRIETRIGVAMEKLDDTKEELTDIVYLGRANVLLFVKTILDDIENADEDEEEEEETEEY